MKTFILTALLLFPANAFCQEFQIPGISDVNIPFEDARYQQAINKAVQATAAQTGITANINLFTSKTAEIATQKATYVIGRYTPFKASQVFFVAGVSYAAIVRKQVTKSFRNPMFENVTNTISLSKNRAMLEWRIPLD